MRLHFHYAAIVGKIKLANPRKAYYPQTGLKVLLKVTLSQLVTHAPPPPNLKVTSSQLSKVTHAPPPPDLKVTSSKLSKVTHAPSPPDLKDTPSRL